MLYADEIETKASLRRCLKMDIGRYDGFVLSMTKKVASYVKNNAAVVNTKGLRDTWLSSSCVQSTICVITAARCDSDQRRRFSTAEADVH